MKYHFGIKLTAFFLAVIMLLVTVGSALSIVFLSGYGLYDRDPEAWAQEQLSDRAMFLAQKILDRYTAKKLGKLTQEQLEYAGRGYMDYELSDWVGAGYGTWDYWITDMNGLLLENGVKLSEEMPYRTYSFTMNVDYPVHATLEESAQIEKTTNWNYRDYYYTETEEHFLYYYTSPNYRVHVRLCPESMGTVYTGVSQGALEFLYTVRYHLVAVLAVAVLLLLGSVAYLCMVAGRTPAEPEPRLRGLNRMPLDFFLAFCTAGALLLGAGAVVLLDDSQFLQAERYNPLAVALAVVLFFVAASLVIGFFWVAAAQFKMRDGSWWRRSVIGLLLRKLWKLFRFCFRAVRSLYRMLPLMGQWLITAALMVVVPLLCLFLANRYHYSWPIHYLFDLWVVGAFLADVAMICYGAYCFGLLYRGAKAMARGDLQEKIPTKHLTGAFRKFACELNDLADAAMVAAQRQMKSERMKTELITNVSHDIKTPLTSLINYVDLLQAPHTPEQGQQYLEVLARQSQRMKKLVDDLMDMSKASSGNVQVQIASLDMGETLTQALGEFADKLEKARLTPRFQIPEQLVPVLADGRLTWRVLSNLLSNVVKYAMPGTRVYVDLIQEAGQTRVSIKNISAQPLNVSAEELTERFVRGDVSRNTEGSGLGLNIAQSLMELQSGKLELVVDGDLFKVTLTFQSAV